MCLFGEIIVVSSYLQTTLDNNTFPRNLLKHSFQIIVISLLRLRVTQKPLILSFLVFLSFRSSCSQIFFKIVVLKNFANFTGKHLVWSLFFLKKMYNVIKERIQHRRYFVKSAKFLRTPFLQNTSCDCL